MKLVRKNIERKSDCITYYAEGSSTGMPSYNNGPSGGAMPNISISDFFPNTDFSMGYAASFEQFKGWISYKFYEVQNTLSTAYSSAKAWFKSFWS